ncbi:DUF58 domain-containing protein [Bacillus sp. YZJH907-2]|uniref:DUF58 domain-containing protein n=2 Tax=Halalkalibacter suaedae TaxID=2822140 RepID=A0A940X140_9BACI|nr:DUF58 domain-containing protein [Bacillus suaedae]
MIAFSSISFLLIVASFFGISWTWVLLINGFFIAGSLVDLMLSPNKRQIHFQRTIPEEMERNLTYHVEISVVNESSHRFHFRVVDGLPQSFLRPFPLIGQVNEQMQTVLLYETKAPVRGSYIVDKLHVRYRSVLGLWEKQTTVSLETKVKVIPDLTETKQYLENAQQFLKYEGVNIRRQKKGMGEFSKIRNYVVGDDPRMINWRQTAKLQEVMTNEYEPEHGKYITILIDCGRMMGAELKKGNRLERALEAALTVAAASLQKGDHVSVIAFSNKVKVYVPPAKGMAHLQTILHAIYHLEVDAVESNYADILHYIQTMQRKRSLLLLFSDVRTFLHEESALIYLSRLRRQHLFLMIGVEDRTLLEKASQQPTHLHVTMAKSMAMQQLIIKKREKNKWEKSGLHMLEAREEQLAVTAVSSYIDIMNRGLL